MNRGKESGVATIFIHMGYGYTNQGYLRVTQLTFCCLLSITGNGNFSEGVTICIGYVDHGRAAFICIREQSFSDGVNLNGVSVHFKRGSESLRNACAIICKSLGQGDPRLFLIKVFFIPWGVTTNRTRILTIPGNVVTGFSVHVTLTVSLHPNLAALLVRSNYDCLSRLNCATT